MTRYFYRKDGDYVKDEILEKLKEQEQDAYDRKQIAWYEYIEARDRANEAYVVMRAAWVERRKAAETLNREYNLMLAVNSGYRKLVDQHGNKVKIRKYFNQAQRVFNDAKKKHEDLEMEFQRLKAEQRSKKEWFDLAHAEHKQIKELRLQRRDEIKEKQDQENIQLIEEIGALIGASLKLGENAKVKERKDGNGKDVYFGGLEQCDGPGHGHAVVDKDGQIIYLRDAVTGHGKCLIDISDKVKK